MYSYNRFYPYYCYRFKPIVHILKCVILSLWHCVAYVVLICRQETLKPDTHYPFELSNGCFFSTRSNGPFRRPVRTSSVYRALLAHSVIMAMPTGFTAYRACQGLTLSVGLYGGWARVV